MKFPFMSFTVRVQAQWRKLLGATTHVDNTARVQTVSKKTNPEFWQLIDEFRQLTGIAVLLNTSFNNNAEPIVDSVDDAVVCFLTTGLHYLVVGNYLVSKADLGPSSILELCLSLPAYARLTETMALGNNGDFELTYTIANSYDRNSIPISKEAYQLLIHSGKHQKLFNLLNADSESSSAIVEELWSLWEKRAVVLHPLNIAPVPAAGA